MTTRLYNYWAGGAAGVILLSSILFEHASTASQKTTLEAAAALSAAVGVIGYFTYHRRADVCAGDTRAQAAGVANSALTAEAPVGIVAPASSPRLEEASDEGIGTRSERQIVRLHADKGQSWSLISTGSVLTMTRHDQDVAQDVCRIILKMAIDDSVELVFKDGFLVAREGSVHRKSSADVLAPWPAFLLASAATPNPNYWKAGWSAHTSPGSHPSSLIGKLPAAWPRNKIGVARCPAAGVM